MRSGACILGTFGVSIAASVFGVGYNSSEANWLSLALNSKEISMGMEYIFGPVEQSMMVSTGLQANKPFRGYSTFHYTCHELLTNAQSLMCILGVSTARLVGLSLRVSTCSAC